MSSDFICIRRENQIIITILEDEIQRRLSRPYHAPQEELTFRRAMKKISKLNFIIQNEWHATAINGIGDVVGDVIASGLRTYGRYNRGQGMLNETRRCQKAIKAQIDQAIENRSNKKHIPIRKTYIPKKQPDGQNTATRAMFIVLGLSEINDEKGLQQQTIISRARKWTPVDFSVAHDKYKVCNGWKGMGYLIEKQYVILNKRKKLYQITEKGFKVYMEHINQEVQQTLNDPMRQHMIQNQNRNNRNRNTNNNRNNENDNDNDVLQQALRTWHTQSGGGSHRNLIRNRNNNNTNVNNNSIGHSEDEDMRKAILASQREAQKQLKQKRFEEKQSELNNLMSNENELMQKAILESQREAQKQMQQKRNGLNNRNDDNDEEMQQVLLLSLQTDNNEKETLAETLKLIDQQQKIYNNYNNNNNNNSKPEYNYFCPLCVSPIKKYKTKRNYDKHMKLHNPMNDNNNNNNNNRNNSNQNRINNRNINNNNGSILGKRKPFFYDSESDSEIQILPSYNSHPPKKRQRIRQNNIPKQPQMIPNDLDNILKEMGYYETSKHLNGSVIYKGKRYTLKLYIDHAERNLKSTNINELDLLEWLQSKGINVNNIEYKSLANADYLFVLTDGIIEYMINFAMERKRWDDLEASVCRDTRGKDQKQRLKQSPITRKYYGVEGEKQMITDLDRRQKCQQFLKDTENIDGYMIKYTQSKHKTMDKICEWYFKILILLNRENGIGDELVLFPYTFQDFQGSQRVNKKHVEMVNDLKGMGFDEWKCKQALKAVKYESKQAALDHMLAGI